MNETVSVVIAHYNDARFIDEALESVFAQTYPALEVIVVDDGSRDEDYQHLLRHRERARIIRLAKNSGPAVARNVGVYSASGRWIAFLDSDDSWKPDKLKAAMAYAAAHPECTALHSAYLRIHKGGESIGRTGPLTLQSFLRVGEASPMLLSSAVVQREALFACGLFDPTTCPAEDKNMFLRVAMYQDFHFIDEPLAIRRERDDSFGHASFLRLWRAQDRIVRGSRMLYSSESQYRGVLRRLHTAFAVTLVYKREFQSLWTGLRSLTRDFFLPGTLFRIGWKLVGNRLWPGD